MDLNKSNNIRIKIRCEKETHFVFYSFFKHTNREFESFKAFQYGVPKTDIKNIFREIYFFSSIGTRQKTSHEMEIPKLSSVKRLDRNEMPLFHVEKVFLVFLLFSFNKQAKDSFFSLLK